MIIDKLLSTTAIALTTLTTASMTALNSPVLDFGVAANQGLVNQSGYGPGWVITVAGATSGGASTLSVQLVTAADAALTSPTVLWTVTGIALADIAGKGKQFFVPVPNTDDWKRYAAFRAQAGTAVFTGGTIEVEYTSDIRKWRAYPSVLNT